MESSQDYPVEAQEDSSSLDVHPVSNATAELASIERTVDDALEDESSRLPIVSRLFSHVSNDCSIDSQPPSISKSSEASGEAGSIGNPENPLTDSTIRSTIDFHNVDSVYDPFFSEELQATSSNVSSPSRKRAAPEFLPINAEIKRIGVEISEEHAKQVKNDIRRLSPVLVSLRERTLGEISLTSDSGLFDDANQSIRIETDERSPDLNRSCETNSDQSNEDKVQGCQVDGSQDYSLGNLGTSEIIEPAAETEVLEQSKSEEVEESRLEVKNTAESPVRISQDVVNIEEGHSAVGTPNERLNGQRELMIVLSRVDGDSPESKARSSNGDDKADRVEGSGAEALGDRTGETRQDNFLPKDAERPHQADFDCNDTSVPVGDFCLSPKYRKNDQLSRKSPKVVIERTIEAAGSSPSKIDRTEHGERSDLDCVRRVLADNMIDDEVASEEKSEVSDPLRLESTDVANPEAASEIQESVDTETETETGSDSSELNSITSISPNECPEPTNCGSSCQETDPLVSDEVPSDVMTRLEPERPEAFTEDSAESLALATGNRDEVRSDGSDSGLGSEIPGDPGPTPAPESDSETSFLDRIPDDILSDKDKAVNSLEAFVTDAGTSGTQQNQQQQQPIPSFPNPPKSSLKRRLTDCMEGEPSPKRINTEDPMRKKRNIQFDDVTVYYFPRSQGFTCVPSQGGSTLGMSATHTHAERFSLAEHATEQRRLHRARLAQLRSERAANCVTEAASSSEDPSDDTDEEPSDTEELDIDSYYFLQPVPTWQRRALLRAAGVRRIDAVEKDECRDIRASREHCGCGCKGYCDPESCPCSRANVKCQVDRAGFPCGCSRDGCANSSGRIEFNPVRVRTHFIHTLMRLQLEKKQRDEDRTDHDLLPSNQASRGPMREAAGIMTSGLTPMDHPSVITGDPVSCINAGGFTTLHYENHENNSASCQPIVHGAREDSLDLYAIRDDCYPGEADAVDGAQNSQRKLHPEFGQAFQAFPGQQPGVNFPQGAYQDYQGYQNLASTSRSQFQPQFQTIPPANTSFSHYGYGQDPNVLQNSCQPHPTPHHTVYESTFSQEDPNSQQQYTNLNSVQPMNAVVQQMGKLEPFSELLAGRYSYYGEVEQPIGTYHNNTNAKIEPEKNVNVAQDGVENNAADDCDENFGEIIKKSMVETVSA